MSSNMTVPASPIAIINLPLFELNDFNIFNEFNTECLICYERIERGSYAVALPCGHYFHKQCNDRTIHADRSCCYPQTDELHATPQILLPNHERCNSIEQWLRQHNTCPSCRFEIVSSIKTHEFGRFRRMQQQKLSGDTLFVKYGEFWNKEQLRALCDILMLPHDKCVDKGDLLTNLSESGYYAFKDPHLKSNMFKIGMEDRRKFVDDYYKRVQKEEAKIRKAQLETPVKREAESKAERERLAKEEAIRLANDPVRQAALRQAEQERIGKINAEIEATRKLQEEAKVQGRQNKKEHKNNAKAAKAARAEEARKQLEELRKTSG